MLLFVSVRLGAMRAAADARSKKWALVSPIAIKPARIA
jgi:hypothetical protein